MDMHDILIAKKMCCCEGGGGDFSTAEITVINTSNPDYNPMTGVKCYLPIVEDNGIVYTYGDDITPVEVPAIFIIPLYKGKFTSIGVSPVSDIVFDENFVPEVSGNISYVDDTNTWTITGDCTIYVGAQK